MTAKTDKNKVYGRKSDLQTLPFGNTVALTQKAVGLILGGEPGDAVIQRTLLGLYRKYARVDIEAKKCLREDRRFQNAGPIDLDAFFAWHWQIGSLFNILCGSVPISKMILAQLK